MKRLWVCMVALGLVAVFSATVFAVDVKFSGEFAVGKVFFVLVKQDFDVILVVVFG